MFNISKRPDPFSPVIILLVEFFKPGILLWISLLLGKQCTTYNMVAPSVSCSCKNKICECVQIKIYLDGYVLWCI